jgi:hypothetical protein
LGKYPACSLELLAAYFHSANSVFLSRKSVNSTFSRLFSAPANKLIILALYYTVSNVTTQDDAMHAYNTHLHARASRPMGGDLQITRLDLALHK